MNNYIFVLFLVSAMAFSATYPSKGAADAPPSGLYVVPSVGYMFFANKNNLDDSPAMSLGLGYQFDSPLGFELVFLSSDAESKTSPHFNTDYQHVRLDALYHFSGGTAVNPYFVAGIGDGSYDSSVNGSNPDQQSEANMGIGVLGYFSNHFALRGDIRTIFGQEDELGHVLFNVGLVYSFSSKEFKKRVEPDLDNDGVPDRSDDCLRTPSGVSVDKRGCALDTDGDGVTDYKDKCPDTTKGVTVDVDGCPLDTDKDGVIDDIDKCPETPAGAKVDEVGCRLQLEKTVEISMQLGFKTGSAEVLPEHGKEINKVGVFMVQYPDTKVLIEGHSDSQGAAKYNEKLSEKRAESVRLNLISTFNLDPERITSQGYGESRPIANNGTTMGRAQNRRVVAVIKASIKVDPNKRRSSNKNKTKLPAIKEEEFKPQTPLYY